MSILGPDGAPLNEPDPPAVQRVGPMVPVPGWGMSFVVRPDGTVLVGRYYGEDGDMHVQKVVGDDEVLQEWAMLRCRPTDRGHLVLNSLEEWFEFADAEIEATRQLIEQQAAVLAEAEAATEGSPE